MRPNFIYRSFSFSFIVACLLAGGFAVAAKIKIGNLPKEAVATHPIRTQDGNSYTLQGLRGQVVVLDFFTVWCVHSREHIPALNRFDDADRERGLRVIGMIVNDKETTQARIDQFLKEQKLAFPISITNDFHFQRFTESKDIAVPQTLVFARNGRLAAHFVGHDAATEAALHNVVKQELAKKI
jgi:thiol-disulfide isomerase/thioredoxin